MPDPNGGGATIPCPCNQEHALHVTLLSEEHGKLSLRVEEVLHGDLPLVAGDVIEASRYDDTLACFVGCAALKVGDQAFAFYRPAEPAPPPCAERDACIAACWAKQATSDVESWRSQCMCRNDPPNGFATPPGSRTCGVTVRDGAPDCDHECAQATRDACPPPSAQDYKRGHVGLSPWTDPIVFARNERGEVSLARKELGELWRDESADPRQNLLRCIERVGDWSTLLESAP